MALLNERFGWVPGVVCVACVAALAACGKKAGPNLSVDDVAVAFVDRLPAAPADPAWQRAPVHPAKLLLQDMVDPRLVAPSTPSVDVQAVSDGRSVAFRLSWVDTTKDDTPKVAQFADACAVQLPSRMEADVPAPQMGEPGKPVEITYWSAFFQAMVDGRQDDMRALHPNMQIDHYPAEAPPLASGSPERQAAALRYAPARALGNLMAGPRTKPVQELVAHGPGTLAPSGGTAADGKGVYSQGKGWAVVLTRPLPAGLAPGGRTQVAFAVWQGAAKEVGSRKMRTAWIPLLVERKP